MVRTDQFERSETPAEIKLKNTEYGRDTEITIVKRSGVIILRSFDNEVVFGLDSLKAINKEIEKMGWLEDDRL